MDYQVAETETFATWLGSLRDRNAKAVIVDRVLRLQRGLFGDRKSVGGGVSELRINVAKGYRVYYTVRGETVVILLCGGDKSSQSRDIRRAQQLA